jgi:hypothetical protein
VVGLAVRFALGSTRADGDPANTPATRAAKPATAPTSVVNQLTTTSACLEAASRADQIIESLITQQARQDC